MLGNDKLSESECEELERYIQHNPGYRIYRALKGDDPEIPNPNWIKCIEPLVFFRLLKDATRFVDEHKDRPLFVRSHFETLGLNHPQLDLLHYALFLYFARSEEFDKINICLWEISAYLDTLPDRKPKPSRRDPFDVVLSRLETCPDMKAKIVLLIEEKTKWQQAHPHERTGAFVHTFGEKCDLEINKYKNLAQLSELNAEQSAGSERGSSDEYNPTKRGLTRQLAMLLLDELPGFEFASNQAKAEFLALFTGWNPDGLRTKWSDYRQGNPESLSSDRKKVDLWKKKLKISE